MTRSFSLMMSIVALLVVADSTSQTSAQGLFARLQPTSPSDQPVELLPPQPTLPSSPRIQQPPVIQQPYVQQPYIQKPLIVQKPAVYCPDYCVTYRSHRRRRSCCGYCTPTQMIVPVADPVRCGCAAEVCITVPSCCTGAPHVTSKVGLFGRGIVIYKWPNGQMVQVIFKKHVPEVMVHTFY